MKRESLAALAALVGLSASVTLGCALAPPPAAPAAPPPPGILLEELTWVEAERILTAETVVVLPLGAQSKEHGPHLKLRNDFILAQYLKNRVRQRSRVVIAPTVNYSFYPAFVEYPGSTTLTLETARDVIVEVCRSLARYGPRRFYVLNTGVSTVRALGPAAQMLAADGILMRYTDLNKTLSPIEKKVSQQEGGTHADEIETSMILYMEPAAVDMSKAVTDYHPSGKGGLTRDPNGPGTYSPTGTWGDPTLASREKGRIVVEAFVDALVLEIEELRAAPLPGR
ncbi:MAG: creatininase family protein [Thermoanaerobaculia bacterium]